MDEYIRINKLLTIENFMKLPTKRKLTYFKKYRRIEHYGMCDCGCNQRNCSEEDMKYYETGDEYVQKLREILNTCENV